MECRFSAFPDAIQSRPDICSECRCDLGAIQEQYPYGELTACRSAQQALASLTDTAAARMFPYGLPPAYRDQIDHLLRLIDQLAYAPYFLTVNSIVAES